MTHDAWLAFKLYTAVSDDDLNDLWSELTCMFISDIRVEQQKMDLIEAIPLYSQTQLFCKQFSSSTINFSNFVDVDLSLNKLQELCNNFYFSLFDRHEISVIIAMVWKKLISVLKEESK